MHSGLTTWNCNSLEQWARWHTWQRGTVVSIWSTSQLSDAGLSALHARLAMHSLPLTCIHGRDHSFCSVPLHQHGNGVQMHAEWLPRLPRHSAESSSAHMQSASAHGRPCDACWQPLLLLPASLTANCTRKSRKRPNRSNTNYAENKPWGPYQPRHYMAHASSGVPVGDMLESFLRVQNSESTSNEHGEVRQ